RQSYWQHAHHHRDGGHQYRAQPFLDGLDERVMGRVPLLFQLIRKVNDKNGILRHQPDEHDNPEDRENTQGLSRKSKRPQSTYHGERNREKDDKRINEVVIQGHHNQVYEENGSQERQSQRCERLLLILLVTPKRHSHTCRLIHTVDNLLYLGCHTSRGTPKQLCVNINGGDPVITLKTGRT